MGVPHPLRGRGWELTVERVEGVLPGVDLWWARVKDLARESGAELLCSEERERMLRFRLEADRRAFLVKRLLVRGVLSAYAGVDFPAEAWRFAVEEQGRPRLAPEWDGLGLRFSLARSGEMVVCAVARGGAVGVDVEDMLLRVEEELPEGVLAENEQEGLRGLAGAVRREAFLGFWTLKEAYGKGLGCGLLVDEPEYAGGESWRFVQGMVGGRYVMAVVHSSTVA